MTATDKPTEPAQLLDVTAVAQLLGCSPAPYLAFGRFRRLPAPAHQRREAAALAALRRLGVDRIADHRSRPPEMKQGGPGRARPAISNTPNPRGISIMADKPLNFNPDDLGAFDRAADPADDLAAFDAATGATCVPAGWYLCKLEAGELVPTKTGKTAYRLRFVVVEPAAHAGFPLWRYYTFADPANANRAKGRARPARLAYGRGPQGRTVPETRPHHPLQGASRHSEGRPFAERRDAVHRRARRARRRERRGPVRHSPRCSEGRGERVTTYAELRSSDFAFGANCVPPAHLAGGFVDGALNATRHVVSAELLFRAYHECDDVATDREAYGTVYQYPAGGYGEYVRRCGTPKRYDGPAACCRLVWDIDRKGDLDAALTDARALVRFLLDRYGLHAENGLGTYFSGSKGFHLTLVAVPGFYPLVHVPAVVKLLCTTLAPEAPARERRSPDLRPPAPFPPAELPPPADRALQAVPRPRRIVPARRGSRPRGWQRHPAGFREPTVTEDCERLADDWMRGRSTRHRGMRPRSQRERSAAAATPLPLALSCRTSCAGSSGSRRSKTPAAPSLCSAALRRSPNLALRPPSSADYSKNPRRKADSTRPRPRSNKPPGSHTAGRGLRA